MGLFSKPEPPQPKTRRPVAEICADFTEVLNELQESASMAAAEQEGAEAAIIALQATRREMISEQQRAAAVTDNLKKLLALDIDGDGEPDDLDLAIAHMKSAPAPAETPTDDTSES